MAQSRLANIRLKAAETAKRVNDTFQSTTTVFERHKVAFTIGASLASAAAAWAGYTARQLHQKKLEERLKAIEHAMTTVHNLEEEQVNVLRAAVTGGVGYQACVATAATTLVIGYALGWRGGRAFTLRRIQESKSLLTLAPNVHKA